MFVGIILREGHMFRWFQKKREPGRLLSRCVRPAGGELASVAPVESPARVGYVKIVTLDFVQHHKMVLIPVQNTGQSVGAQIFQSYPARDSLEPE